MAVSNTKTPYVSDIYHRHPGVCNVRVLLWHSCGRIQSGKKRGERKKKKKKKTVFQTLISADIIRVDCVARAEEGGDFEWLIRATAAQLNNPRRKEQRKRERNENRRRHVHMYTGHTGDPIYIAWCSNPLCVLKRTRPTARSVSPSLAHHQIDKAIYFLLLLLCTDCIYTVYSQLFSLLRLFAQFLLRRRQYGDSPKDNNFLCPIFFFFIFPTSYSELGNKQMTRIKIYAIRTGKTAISMYRCRPTATGTCLTMSLCLLGIRYLLKVYLFFELSEKSSHRSAVLSSAVSISPCHFMCLLRGVTCHFQYRKRAPNNVRHYCSIDERRTLLVGYTYTWYQAWTRLDSRWIFNWWFCSLMCTSNTVLTRWSTSVI